MYLLLATQANTILRLQCASSPVKIKRFHIYTQGNAKDYVMSNDVSIEHYPDIGFEEKPMPTTMNICVAKTLV